tara:strand:- start:130 stop:390 length:261 start_codon:yes stop_codon:yes gene_type:complete
MKRKLKLNNIMKKLHIYFMNGFTFLIALGVLVMVANVLVHILKTDLIFLGDFLAWMIGVGVFVGSSFLVLGLLIENHKQDLKELKN